VRRTAGYTLICHKGNKYNLEELKVHIIIKIIQNYQTNREQKHVKRMINSRETRFKQNIHTQGGGRFKKAA
jgi:hypothetical protein